MGLFWTGENDMVVFQCTDPHMSRYVTETMAGNMGEINCVIKQGQGIVLPLCFQDILILFIYILYHLVIFFPGLVQMCGAIQLQKVEHVHPSFLPSLLIEVICYFSKSIFICLKWHKCIGMTSEVKVCLSPYFIAEMQLQRSSFFTET